MFPKKNTIYTYIYSTHIFFFRNIACHACNNSVRQSRVNQRWRLNRLSFNYVFKKTWYIHYFFLYFIKKKVCKLCKQRWVTSYTLHAVHETRLFWPCIRRSWICALKYMICKRQRFYIRCRFNVKAFVWRKQCPKRIFGFSWWGFSILDFGILGILDFGGFGDFGFCDFGDFGFWDFGEVQGMYH